MTSINNMTSISGSYNIPILGKNNLTLDLDNIIIKSRNDLNSIVKNNSGVGFFEKLRKLRQLIINEAHEITICSNFADGGFGEPTKIRLKDLLLSDDIVTTDKIKYFSRYLDGAAAAAAAAAAGAGVVVPDLFVLRIKSANNGSVIKYFDNKNNVNAEANTAAAQSNLKNDRLSSFKVAKTLNDVAAAAAAPNQGSQAEVPGAAAPLANRKFPGGYFSFTVAAAANNFSDNSVLSQINQAATTFELVAGNPQIEIIKNNLRELLLNLYNFIYGFRGKSLTDTTSLMNYLKSNLSLIYGTSSFNKYLEYYNTYYNDQLPINSETRYIFDVINDIIISCVRISVYIVSYSIMNVIKPGIQKELMFSAIDILSIILTKFSNNAFIDQYVKGDKYNIFIYNNSKENLINTKNNTNLLEINDLLDFYILKILNILLVTKYKYHTATTIKYVFSSVINTMNINIGIIQLISFWFIEKIKKNPTHVKYGLLLLLIYIKIVDYIDVHQIDTLFPASYVVKASTSNEIFRNLYGQLNKMKVM
jgi:hypothetical protein